jgi:hypothetical protein
MAIRAFITLKNLSIWDSGQYACVAENEEGEGVAKFKLQVLRNSTALLLFYIKYSSRTHFKTSDLRSVKSKKNSKKQLLNGNVPNVLKPYIYN